MMLGFVCGHRFALRSFVTGSVRVKFVSHTGDRAYSSKQRRPLAAYWGISQCQTPHESRSGSATHPRCSLPASRTSLRSGPATAHRSRCFWRDFFLCCQSRHNRNSSARHTRTSFCGFRHKGGGSTLFDAKVVNVIAETSI